MRACASACLCVRLPVSVCVCLLRLVLVVLVVVVLHAHNAAVASVDEAHATFRTQRSVRVQMPSKFLFIDKKKKCVFILL